MRNSSLMFWFKLSPVCPVVSTDCPGGKRETLENANYGGLGQVADLHVLANAIIAQVQKHHDPEYLETTVWASLKGGRARFVKGFARKPYI